MCFNCYHSKGRNKKAWKCEHSDKLHYALGLCRACYVSRNSTVKIYLFILLEKN
jgi:hypothetical protein